MADSYDRHGSNDLTEEIAADVAAIAQALFSAGGTDETVARIVELAVETIDGCDFAGLVVLRGTSLVSLAGAGADAQRIEAIQDRTGEGPCISATGSGTMLYSEVLAEDERWPGFGPAAVLEGVDSILAVPFTYGTQIGALNLYARLPRAFSIVDRARGQMLASLAALALSTAQSHEDEDRRTANLNTALSTREVIGQAQGILMERERITAEQAFDVLRRASQRLNIKLREVAQDLIDTQKGHSAQETSGGHTTHP